MDVVKTRAIKHKGGDSAGYCTRGEQCKLYDAGSGKSQKLGRYHEGDICDRCKMAMVDEDLEVLESTHSVSYESVSYKENPRRARLVVVKRNLVAQLLARRGDFWEAIEGVRILWQLDPVQTQLPPDSEDILYPRQTPPRQPRPQVFNLPINHPKAQHAAWLNQTRSWESDLCDLLLRTLPFPEAKSPPYTGTLSPPKRLLPWLRFAAACALYDPPPEKAPAFADYGGLPLLPGEETQDDPIPGVLTERELRERETDLMVQIAIDNEVFEKVWALRSKLGELDFQGAIRAVRSRYPHKLEERQDLLKRHWHGREVDFDSPLYYVPFDPLEDTRKDVGRVVNAIQEKEGPAQKAGRKPQDDLLPVMCATLLEKPAWSPELLADKLKISAKRVRELAKEGQALR